jgi:DNA polymerase elongation subunit (family B)
VIPTAESSRHSALVFDIETIADLSPDNRDAIAALATDRNMTVEEYGGLCPPLARVVCIAWFDVAADKLGAGFDATLCANEPPRSIRVEGGSADTRTVMDCEVQACNGEPELLRHFGRLVGQHLLQPNAQLVTYNGRGFDLPVLVHRSRKHGITEGRDLLSKAAMENRYRPLLHVDLLDVVTFGGASSRWPMAAYAIGYGLRSPKAELSGAHVWDAVQAGRIADVVRYCAGDVLATVQLHTYLQD